MSWEETILFIRTNADYKDLVDKAYLDEDLALNVKKFRESLEFSETLNLIKKHAPDAQKLVDLGAGNGISSLAFALSGYEVTAIEPDPSHTVGIGAIQWLKQQMKVEHLYMVQAFAENIPLPDAAFDVVYARQTMHHAQDLHQFMAEAFRILKPKGILCTTRDHVVFNEKDKAWFLATHPLQKYYHGENAFTAQQYRQAMKEAGFQVITELKHFESPINYFPMTQEDVIKLPQKLSEQRRTYFQQNFKLLSKIPGLQQLYQTYLHIKQGGAYNERNIPGRLHSYLAQKL